MKSTIKLSLVLLLVGMFIFSPLVGFAQEKGKVTQGKMAGQSVEDTAEPSPEGDYELKENPDPTSSPLAEEYKHKCSPKKPGKPHKPHH